jgi:hypothetical protein
MLQIQVQTGSVVYWKGILGTQRLLFLHCYCHFCGYKLELVLSFAKLHWGFPLLGSGALVNRIYFPYFIMSCNLAFSATGTNPPFTSHQVKVTSMYTAFL